MTTLWDQSLRAAGANERGRAVTRILWGGGGFLLGVLVAIITLVVFAPHPKVVAPSPRPDTDLMVTLDDQYLARLVEQGIAKAKLPFTLTNIRAHISAHNVITISANLKADPNLPATSDLSAQAQISASAGTVALSNLAGTAGGLTLPDPVANILETAINARLATEKDYLTRGGIHYDIVGLSSTDGRLTISLTFT